MRWLGFEWGERFYYTADYFDRLYECAEQLITKGKAHVCDLKSEQVSEYRGLWNQPGTDSPSRG